MKPKVSVAIPTWNGGERLRALLAAIDGQRAAFEIDTVAVDSGSTDGTLDHLRNHAATIVRLAPGAFNHGESRNVALTRARGEFAVVIVQDAVPADGNWLTELIRPLQDDPRVAGSFARQQPWPEASRLTTHYLSRWAAAQPQPRVHGPITRDAFQAMPPAERHLSCAFDNVCACVRLDVWRRIPFRRAAIAEDLEWALEVQIAGYRIAYAPRAVVWHSHDRPASYELQRTYLVHQRLQTLFGLATVPTVPALVRAIGVSLPLHVRLAAAERRGRLRALARGAGLAVALPLGQYLGARSAREGRELLRTRDV